jgi:hypothetical protein
MKLERTSEQAGQSLDEFYRDLAQSPTSAWRSIGSAMLSLVQRLREVPDPREVWCVTSHTGIALLAEPSWRSPWLVQILGQAGDYTVDYLLPPQVAPWPDARVRGEAKTEDRALEMVLIAMKMSQGWK